MTNMETGTVQLLTEATALSRKPGRDTGAAIRSSPAKTAMMQGGGPACGRRPSC